MAGVYFAFSGFIMTALSRIDQASGVAAMNSINTVILRSLFMPLFVGTTLAALILAITAVFRWSAPGSVATLVGGVAYVVGMFVVTMLLNVPLNNALQAVDPASADAATTRARYLRVVDDVESRADHRFGGGLRALHRGAYLPLTRESLGDRDDNAGSVPVRHGSLRSRRAVHDGDELPLLDVPQAPRRALCHVRRSAPRRIPLAGRRRIRRRGAVLRARQTLLLHDLRIGSAAVDAGLEHGRRLSRQPRRFAGRARRSPYLRQLEGAVVLDRGRLAAARGVSAFVCGGKAGAAPGGRPSKSA